jgi:DNA-binding beta-propeller fold protein YncE
LTSNLFSNEVIEFDASGNGTTVLGPGDGLGGPFGENGIAIDRDGQVYVANFNSMEILRFRSDYTHWVRVRGFRRRGRASRWPGVRRQQ